MSTQVAISVDAPGKVNLYLAVGDVRPDGYHPLTTLFAAVSLTETITVSEGQTPGLSLSMDIVPGSLVDQQMQAAQRTRLPPSLLRTATCTQPAAPMRS